METLLISCSVEITWTINSNLIKINIINKYLYKVKRGHCNIPMAIIVIGVTSNICSLSWQILIPKINELYNHHRYTHSILKVLQVKSRSMLIIAISKWREAMTQNSPCRNRASDSKAKSSWRKAKIIKCQTRMTRIHKSIWKSSRWPQATSTEHHKSSLVLKLIKRIKVDPYNQDKSKMLGKVSIIITMWPRVLWYNTIKTTALVLINPDMETLTTTISIMEVQASERLDNSQDRTPRTLLEAIWIKITIIRIMFIQITQLMAAEKIAKIVSQVQQNMFLWTAQYLELQPMKR